MGTLISVRTPNLMNIPYWFQSRIQSYIESAIDHLRAIGHKRIRILCNDSRDLDFATVFRYSKNVDSVYTNDVYQYLALLKSARMVVSFRLHATLPAVAFGTPTVNIIYDERALSLFSDLKMAPHCLNLVELGRDFESALRNQIDSGGYGSSNHKSLVEDWRHKTTLQFSKLSEFKQMMERYLRTGKRQ